MRKILPLCAAVAFAASFSVVTPVHAAEPSDFVRTANQINLEEIELGHYAAEHGERHEVRDYGAKLADEHQEAEDKLHEVAHHHDMHLRGELDDEHQAKVDHLEHLHGREFDHAFIHAMIDGHRDAIGVFEEASHHAEHKDVRDYASDMLPHLHHHLDMASDIEDHMHD
jgi:putative membrane protein